jgi:hypothetical protein
MAQGSPWQRDVCLGGERWLLQVGQRQLVDSALALWWYGRLHILGQHALEFVACSSWRSPTLRWPCPGLVRPGAWQLLLLLLNLLLVRPE